MSEEEVAEAGGVAAEAVRLKCGERLEDVEGCVLQTVSDKAQTQVHGICKRENTTQE